MIMMVQSVLEEVECMVCGRTILVDVDGLYHERATGMWAYDENDDFCGYICDVCAFKLAQEGVGLIAMAGGLAPTFHYVEYSEEEEEE